jgi:large subunit ribosomal protein L26e
MKFSPHITISRKKNRKKLFNCHSNERRKKMIAPLSKDLKEKYNVSKKIYLK